jgi:hypothetical protein
MGRIAMVMHNVQIAPVWPVVREIDTIFMILNTWLFSDELKCDTTECNERFPVTNTTLVPKPVTGKFQAYVCSRMRCMYIDPLAVAASFDSTLFLQDPHLQKLFIEPHGFSG